VRTLVTDPQVPVQWIFIGKPIAELLIQHARKHKEPELVIERALAVMHQPSDAQSHMDHWHVRIFCAPSDRYQGCLDRGPARWLKKDLKYLDTPHPVAPLQLDLAGLGLQRHRLAGL
jgi:penicillin-insensitive murein endopeptidase